MDITMLLKISSLGQFSPDDKLKNDEKIFTLTHITHILIC